jgi:poly(3-hydroxybutyrate) depolymerase
MSTFKKAIRFIICVYFLATGLLAKANNNIPQAAPGEYTIVVEGYDWGPAVSKIILQLDTLSTIADYRDYSVFIEKNSDCVEIPVAAKIGSRMVLYAFISDKDGNRAVQSTYATLVLAVSPNMALASPFQYSVSGKCRGNNWVDYKVTVTNSRMNKVWNKQRGRILPLVDAFDLTGEYNYEVGKTMSYAAFTPKTTLQKTPLIIWLHGGGEGGTDPTIPLLGNRAANYASQEIQSFFAGAYVLVPQCPGAWMHNKAGVTAGGKEDDIYNTGLLALIKNFVNTHPDIDSKRIYVGGCSNGGYMALKLMLADPNYFAAGYISALAYQSQYITDAQIKSIHHIPIWFVHSKDDSTTVADRTVIPVYNRLKASGAKNVHMSLYNRVTDITGFFGGENYYYNGHWSWIFSHANKATTGADGLPVKLNERPVTIMEWMAAQIKKTGK